MSITSYEPTLVKTDSLESIKSTVQSLSENLFTVSFKQGQYPILIVCIEFKPNFERNSSQRNYFFNESGSKNQPNSSLAVRKEIFEVNQKERPIVTQLSFCSVSHSVAFTASTDSLSVDLRVDTEKQTIIQRVSCALGGFSSKQTTTQTPFKNIILKKEHSDSNDDRCSSLSTQSTSIAFSPTITLPFQDFNPSLDCTNIALTLPIKIEQSISDETKATNDHNMEANINRNNKNHLFHLNSEPSKQPIIQFDTSIITSNNNNNSNLPLWISSPIMTAAKLPHLILDNHSNSSNHSFDKKNVVKNFVKAFDTFFLDHHHNSEFMDRFDLSCEQLHKIRKEYEKRMRSMKFNNKMIISIILSNVKDIFEFFLCTDAKKWIEQSSIYDKKAHCTILSDYLRAVQNPSEIPNIVNLRVRNRDSKRD